MRWRSAAKREASSPPAAARTSTITSLSAKGSFGSRASRRFSLRGSTGACGLRVAAFRDDAAGAVQRVAEAAQLAVYRHDVLQRGVLAGERLQPLVVAGQFGAGGAAGRGPPPRFFSRRGWL